jgi:hypothetical protein
VFAFWSGILAGLLHVLSGPDHLAAVLPLAARSPQHGRAVGAVWGLGHGGGMLAWLALAWAFQRVLPIELISGAAELLVGLSLVALGFWTFRASAQASPYERRAALGMGVLHGTAGASHLVSVLPLLGLSAVGGALYCAGFALSGVAAMASAGSLMAKLGRSERAGSRARAFCALIAVSVGSAWIALSLCS